jgi:exodeoxyribonuclease V beta subunit
MSHLLNPLSFPLHGTRLIEASAGTGKTWTIAALYLRLVLGHGIGDTGHGRPLQPSDILVMTFTKAATRELSDRIRERLLDAARYFRGVEPGARDAWLDALLEDYRGDPDALARAAHRLALAADAMDDAAIFTIDAWCQSMLREHAFDSGALFDEDLIENEDAMRLQAARDYWRSHVLALPAAQFDRLYQCWPDFARFDKAVGGLVERAGLIEGASDGEQLAAYLSRMEAGTLARLAVTKRTWSADVGMMVSWFSRNRAAISGTVYRNATVDGFFSTLTSWANCPASPRPAAAITDAAWKMWDPARLRGAVKQGCQLDSDPPAAFSRVAALKLELDALPTMKQLTLAHAAVAIARRMQSLKADACSFGFADMLARLKAALELENGAALRSRILTRYPVALIDEFQDTSPDQYDIFDRLYDVSGAYAQDSSRVGLFLIGDPKQAIYGFRGADIQSYLRARHATQGRHYWLGTNFRSTAGVVAAVNQLFLHAEGKGEAVGHPKAAFGFRNGQHNALPFQEVAAQGRAERLQRNGASLPAMTVLVGEPEEATRAADMQRWLACHCAQQIAELLDDRSVGFSAAGGTARLQPADIAILVRNKFEAAAIQAALHERGVPNVYLSDGNSVLASPEAADVLRWLLALADPLDGALVRCALATRTAHLPLAELGSLAVDDLAWEARVEQFKELKQIWQRQGVLVMLRRFIQVLRLPERLLVRPGGERSLTNLLHLAELLQRESARLDGEQGLVRWLGEQVADGMHAAEEHILRLESDAQLVKIVTIYKSKGLEYPLVFLPFAAACRPVTSGKRDYFEYFDTAAGRRRIDFSLSPQVCAAADQARLEEEIRLLYVALTRARHALWLGVADAGGAFRHSALCYLLNGGAPVAAGELRRAIETMASGCGHIAIYDLPAEVSTTHLSVEGKLPALRPASSYRRQTEHQWTVASYSAIARGAMQSQSAATPAAQKMGEQKLEQEATAAAPAPGQAAAWHRFPRGALPGLFIHELLEWMLEEGFRHAGQVWYREQLVARCERGAWKDRKEELADWLLQAVQTALPALGAPLAAVCHGRAETEFWIPTARLRTAELDRLCQAAVAPGLARPSLSPKELGGMLHGFIDLVFEHNGRYWILDYKSNALGAGDGAYHAAALQEALVAKRYDVQGMLYLLALHRLLRSRLGSAYLPERQLGGALFLFLRGVGNAATRGCCPIVPDLALLEELDRLLPAPELECAA